MFQIVLYRHVIHYKQWLEYTYVEQNAEDFAIDDA